MAKFSTVHDADDHSGIEILGLTTAEVDDALVLAPDGAGGVEFRAETGGGGSSLVGGRVVRSAGDITRTGATTFADATGMSITLTTGAHRCLVGVVASGYVNNTAGLMALDIDIDGTREGAAATSHGLMLGLQHGTSAEAMDLSFTHLTGVLSAGSHTFKLQMKVGNAGHTFTLNAADPVLVLWVAELDIAA